MIVFEFTSENQILEKLLPPPMRLAVSQNLRPFLRKHWPCQQFFFSCFITKYAGHWRSYENQGASIFK